MTADEAIEILQGLARDVATPPSARVTAIRTLLEIQQEHPPDGIDEARERAIYAIDSPRRRGPRPR